MSTLASLTSLHGSLTEVNSPAIVSVPDLSISLSSKWLVTSDVHEWLNVTGNPTGGAALRGGDPESSGFEIRKNVLPDDKFIYKINVHGD